MPVVTPRAGLGDTVVALDIHLPFSYWRNVDFDYGDPVDRPDDVSVARYARALMAEIASLGADLGCGGETRWDELLPAGLAAGQGMVDDSTARRIIVGSVFFSGGYLGLLYPDDFRDILRAVRRNFYVVEDFAVEAVTFPGSVDMYAASAYLDEHVGALMFEVPTLSARESRDLVLPNVLQALDKTLNVLGSYGAAEFGLRLPVDVPGRTAETWHYLLGQINYYRPVHVEFVELEALKGQTIVQDDMGFAGICNSLVAHGYRDVAPGFLTRADVVPAFVEERTARRGTWARIGWEARPTESAREIRPMQTCRMVDGQKTAGQTHEYLGVGLGAQTLIDGFWTKNTTDLQRYLACSDDCRKLIESVREV